MVGTALLPCDLLRPCDFEEDEETQELRGLLAQFDDLFDICMSRQLTPEEQSELDSLFDDLQKREDAQWRGVDPRIVDEITEVFAVHFPTLRYLLDILPDNYSE